MLENQQQSNGQENVELISSGPSSVLECLVMARPELNEQAGTYLDFSHHFDAARQAMNTYQQGMYEKAKRARDFEDQATVHLRQVYSSMTVSAGYKNIVESLEDKYTPEQIVHMYKKCLFINDLVTSERLQTTSVADNKKKIFMRQQHWQKLNLQGKKEFMGEHGILAPSWYKGTLAEWVTILDTYGNLAIALNQDKAGRLVQSKIGAIRYFDELATLGNTTKDAFPDWYDHIDEVPAPTLEEVSVEFEADRVESEIYLQLVKDTRLQIVNFSVIAAKRFIKGATHFELERRGLEGKNANLFSTMFYLDATKATYEHPTLPITSTNMGDLDREERLKPEESQKRVVAEGVARFGLSSECVALWMEDAMKDGKVPIDMKNLQDMVEFVSTMNGEVDFYDLKTKDKSLHNLLKFQLYPLFSVMTSDELKYIGELAATIESPFEFIIEFAQIVSHPLSALGQEKSLAPIAKSVRQFTEKWIHRNKGNFIGKTLDILSSPRHVGVKDRGTVAEVESIQEEAEKLDEELARMNLDSWDLYLSDGYHYRIGSQQVKGDNFAGYEQTIDNIFQKTGRAFSIKTSSIVRTLDWFLMVPDEIKNLWPKEIVDGVEYYKIKRAGVRILIHEDRSDQSITFIPYQKKSQEYRFRS